MNLTEKVAYLKGLLDGLNPDADSKEGKLFAAIVDVLEDMALSVSDLEDEVVEVENAVDEIDEDLADVEELLYGEDDEEEEYYE
ncbi:MAG: hypothetical protein IJL39_00080, partial [Clostridia bacterium]|nr:hypothetical protein [Clostridia bacterium]